MMRMELIVESARVYGKVLHKGDIFEVPDKEARLWGALARAKPVPYRTANMTTEAVVMDEDRRAHRRTNRYNRRDMRSED